VHRLIVDDGGPLCCVDDFANSSRSSFSVIQETVPVERVRWHSTAGGKPALSFFMRLQPRPDILN
jgi:hypothetical protein